MELFNALLPKLEHLGLWGYWIVLLVALLESLAFVGLFIPGTTVVIIVGFLATHGIFDIGDLLWFVAIGGILGDGISFYLGKHSAEKIKASKLFRASYQNKGEAFFRRFGDLSIILARFIGPIRPVLPFVAGIFGMKNKKFFFYNILGAFASAAAYLLIGFFFGAAWREVHLWFRKFEGIVIIILIIPLVGYMLRNFFLNKTKL